MFSIIYRKSDRLIAGHVYPRRTPEASELAVRVEITNICNGELGGSPNDYAAVENSQVMMPGHEASITTEGAVTFTPLPASTESVQRSRISELLETPRSSWTAAMKAELIELTARLALT